MSQAAAEKKAAALQSEREARRVAEAAAAEADATRQADGRLRRAAERRVSGLEALGSATRCSPGAQKGTSDITLTQQPCVKCQEFLNITRPMYRLEQRFNPETHTVSALRQARQATLSEAGGAKPETSASYEAAPWGGRCHLKTLLHCLRPKPFQLWHQDGIIVTQAKDAEAKLEAQTKRTQEAAARADAAREALKASAAAAAALETQLAALQVPWLSAQWRTVLNVLNVRWLTMQCLLHKVSWWGPKA